MGKHKPSEHYVASVENLDFFLNLSERKDASRPHNFAEQLKKQSYEKANSCIGSHAAPVIDLYLRPQKATRRNFQKVFCGQFGRFEDSKTNDPIIFCLSQGYILGKF